MAGPQQALKLIQLIDTDKHFYDVILLGLHLCMMTLIQDPAEEKDHHG